MALIVFWMQVTAPINPHSEANLARKAHRHLIAAERSTRQQDLSAAEDHLKEAAVYIEKLEKQKAKSGPPNKTSLWLKDTREKIEVSLRRQQSLRLAKEKRQRRIDELDRKPEVDKALSAEIEQAITKGEGFDFRKTRKSLEKQRQEIMEAATLRKAIGPEGRAYISLGKFQVVLTSGQDKPLLYEELSDIPDNIKFYYNKGLFGKKVYTQKETGELYLATRAKLLSDNRHFKVHHGPLYVLKSMADAEYIILDDKLLSRLNAKGFIFYNRDNKRIYYRQLQGYTPYTLLAEKPDISPAPTAAYYSAEGSSEFIIAQNPAEPFICAVKQGRLKTVYKGSDLEKDIIAVFKFPLDDSQHISHHYYSTDGYGRQFEYDKRDKALLYASTYKADIADGRAATYRLINVFMIEKIFNEANELDKLIIYPTLEEAKERRAELAYNLIDAGGQEAYPFERSSFYIRPPLDYDLRQLRIERVIFERTKEKFEKIYLSHQLGGETAVAVAERGWMRDRVIIRAQEITDYINDGWSFYDESGAIIRPSDPAILLKTVSALDAEGYRWFLRPVYFAAASDSKLITAYSLDEFIQKFNEAVFISADEEKISIEPLAKLNDKMKKLAEAEELPAVLNELFAPEAIDKVMSPRGEHYRVLSDKEILRTAGEDKLPLMVWQAADNPAKLIYIYDIEDLLMRLRKGYVPVDASGMRVYELGGGKPVSL